MLGNFKMLFRIMVKDFVRLALLGYLIILRYTRSKNSCWIPSTKMPNHPLLTRSNETIIFYLRDNRRSIHGNLSKALITTGRVMEERASLFNQHCHKMP